MANKNRPPEAPPQSVDPETTALTLSKQAEQFIVMLDQFAELGGAEAKRLQGEILEAITACRDAQDPKKAAEELAAKLPGFEVSVATLLLGSVRDFRDQFAAQVQLAGGAGAAAQMLNSATEGFDLMVAALEKMLAAAKNKDPNLRKEARTLMDEAQAKLSVLANPGG